MATGFVKQAAAVSSKRAAFIDLFRGTFALLMLEGHTMRALLRPSVKAATLFQYHEFAHSLTGPGFLFASGAALTLATIPNWDAYRGWSSKLAKRLIRLTSLLLIGYMLHLTYFSLRRTVYEVTPEQLSSLLNMDILQCIAISGLLLQFAMMVLPDRRWLLGFTVAGCIGIGLATPFMWNASLKLPFWLGTNFSSQWGSTYPLFPYMGFQMAGVAWCCLFLQYREQAAEGVFLRRTEFYGTGLILGGLIVAFILKTILKSTPMSTIYNDPWSIGPAFFFLRIGTLGLFMVLFRAAETRIMPRFQTLALVGRESLTIYIAHLLVLYGSPLNPDRNLLKFLGSDNSPGDVLLILILMSISVVALGWAWNRLKGQHDWKARGVQLSLAGYLIYTFVTG